MCWFECKSGLQAENNEVKSIKVIHLLQKDQRTLKSCVSLNKHNAVKAHHTDYLYQKSKSLFGSENTELLKNLCRIHFFKRYTENQKNGAFLCGVSVISTLPCDGQLAKHALIQ